MILNEKEIAFIRQRLGDEHAKRVFNDIIEKKVGDILDASTFKRLESEKDSSIENVYMARMAAAHFIKDLLQELLRAANTEGEEIIV